MAGRRKRDTDEGKSKSDYSQLFKTLFNQIERQRPETDEELIERINEYIDFCAESGYTASFQALVAYCGFSMGEVQDICKGLSPGLGVRTATIFTRAHEVNRGIDFIKLTDGVNRNAAGTIFEAKQPLTGSAWSDSPQFVIPVQDYLRPANAQPLNIQAIKAMYGLAPAPARKEPKLVEAVEVVEEKDE